MSTQTTEDSALVQELKRLGACREAVEWARGYPDLPSAWAACERGDWMAWLADYYSGNRSPMRKRLVLALCDQVRRLALPHVPDGETRPLTAIEAAERWAREEAVTLDDVWAAAYAATAAAYAATAAANAAADRERALKACADIMREHYPTPPQPEGRWAHRLTRHGHWRGWNGCKPLPK